VQDRLSVSRRGFLATSAAVALTRLSTAEAEVKDGIQPFGRYSELLKTLEARGHKTRVLGHAPDGSPLVAVKAGGEKLPAIVISAGSHATEQAGVRAAVELIDTLKTEHAVYVLPCRDPIGLSGYAYALKQGLAAEPKLGSMEEAEALLREKGDVLLDADGTLLVLIDECGYANRGLYRKIEKGSPVLEPLKGRRIWFPSRYQDVPGSGLFERAYTLIVTPDGEVLHLNRFHDTRWAPVEVRCIRRLMADVKPGLTFDLHEYGGDAFWMSARRQRTDKDEAWERRMAAAAAEAVAASGAKMAAEDYSPGSFFTRLQEGVYWLDPSVRGEGLNLVDFAASKYGPGFTVETGMRQPFSRRVEQQMLVAKTAVALFAERFARR
jgi:hypothetical protein